MTDLVLKHGLCFADLYDREGLVRLDRAFVAHLAQTDVGLHDRLMTARRDPDAIEGLDESNLLVDLAPHLEDFVGELFGIEAKIWALQARHHELAPLYSVKRFFVQRRAVKGVKEPDAVAIDGPVSTNTCCAAGAQKRKTTPPGTTVAPMSVLVLMPA